MRTRRRRSRKGRDFFNEKPRPEYYKPYVYPHPLQEGWEALMKSVADSAGSDSGSAPAKAPAGKAVNRPEDWQRRPCRAVRSGLPL